MILKSQEMVSVRSDRNRKAGGVAFYIRECTLSMQEGGPESFTDFSKKVRSPGDQRPKYFMAW